MPCYQTGLDVNDAPSSPNGTIRIIFPASLGCYFTGHFVCVSLLWCILFISSPTVQLGLVSKKNLQTASSFCSELFSNLTSWKVPALSECQNKSHFSTWCLWWRSAFPCHNLQHSYHQKFGLHSHYWRNIPGLAWKGPGFQTPQWSWVYISLFSHSHTSQTE